MNIEKHLILIKGEDKTESISHCVYENGKWKVQFRREKTYSYRYQNVQWYKNPTSLSPITTVVFHDRQPLSGIDKLFVFEKHIRICFVTGLKKVYERQEITLEQSVLSNPDAHNCLEYLKQLAKIVSVVNEEENSFLYQQYEKITSVSSCSVLAQYLNPAALNKPPHGRMPIFPFGFNLSQKTATENALNEQISVIEGPPGTGKTQTILNIIANAIVNGKTVAVVSNNNAATANVLEKLDKYGIGFIAAYLGNKENKEKFFDNQIQTYPEMSTWMMDAQEYNNLEKVLAASGNDLEKMLQVKNTVAILRQELSALAVEKEYFNIYHSETREKIASYRSLYRHNSDTVMKLWLDYQRRIEKHTVVTLKYKIKNLLRYGIFSFSFYDSSNENIIGYFQKLYYERRIEELNDQIQGLARKLDSYQFDDAIKEYSTNSMKLLKAKLAQRFLKHKERMLFTKESLWKDFGSFIKEYPVILSTTHSLRSCASPNYLFDYIVMDEASQVDIVSGALALSCAKNAIIVGDLKQLPNVVSGEISKESNLIFERYQLNAAYEYSENSMLSSISKLFNAVPKRWSSKTTGCL